MVPPSTDDRPAASSPPPGSPQRRWWLWALAVTAIGIGGGTAAGWYFLRYRLIPLLEAQLSPILGRPVDLGEIEALSLSGVRLGLSQLPPTADDPDRVEIAAIAIDYDLSKIWQRRIEDVRVTVENPQIYIEQAEDGAWLDLELNLPEPPEEARDLPVAISQLEASVSETEIILVPRTPAGELGAEYRATVPTIGAIATENLEQIAFDLAGALEAGTFQVAGDFSVPTGRLEVAQAQVQAVTLAQFVPLLPLPVEALQGEIAADLALAAQLDDPLATFEGTGTLALKDVVANLPQLKEAVTAVGDLRLQGRTLEIEALAAQMGALEASVAGNVDLQTGYDLTATVPTTPIAEILAAIELENPPVDVRGAIAATARATGAIAAPQVSATLRTPAPIAIDRATVGIIEADARLDDTRAILERLRLDAPDGGQVSATGDFDLESGDWSGELAIRELDGEIARPYIDDRALADLGRLNAEGRTRGNINTWTAALAEGNLRWESANGRLAVPNFQLAERQLQAGVEIDALALQSFVPALPATAEPLSGQLNLQAQLPAALSADTPLPEALRARASGQFQVAGGDLRLQEARLQDGLWQVQAALAALPVADLIPPELIPEPSAAPSEATALADLQQLIPQLAAQRSPQLGSLRDLGLAQQLPFQIPPASPRPLTAPSGSADLSELLQATTLGAQIRANGRVDRLELDAIDLDGSARLENLAAGTVTVPTLSLKAGQGRLQLQPAAVRLDLLAAALGQPVLVAPTPVTGELEVTAPVAGLLTLSGDDYSALADVRANGRLNFSEGLAVVTEPLSVSLVWDGERLNLLQASAPNFQAEGFATLDPQATGLAIVGPYDFSVAAANLDLARAPLPPETIVLDGRLSLDGRAQGGGLRNPPPEGISTPQDVAIAPEFNGDLRFENLVVNNYTFDPEITGTIRADLERGLNVALAGRERDRLEFAATLADPGRPLPIEPQTLNVRLGEAAVDGRRVGEEFQVALANIPLQQLQPLLPPTVSIPDIAGSLSGDLAVNLATFDGRGALEIAQLQAANTFRSRLVSADFAASPNTGRFTLNEGRLLTGESDYRLQAEVNLDAEDWQNFENIRYEARLEAPQARLRDVFSTLQLQTIADLGRGFGSATYGDASDLDITPIELADRSLGERLERLEAVEQELAALRAQQNTMGLPPFSAIAGDFALAAEIAGRGLDPAAATGEITLDGQAWQWGNLAAQEATVRLEIADGLVTLLPLRLASGDSSIELTGSTDFDFSNLVASLAVRDIPIELARDFVEFPPAIGFGGSFEVDIAASGSPTAPSATGEFAVANATINETPIARVEGGFTYNRSQLLFSAEGAIGEESEPVTLVGTVPLQLPTSPVAPPSDRLEVNVAIRDEAFAFLDVLTNNQLRWGGGKAAIELDIAGPFDFQNFQPSDLVADGRATFADAQLVSAILSEPVMGITGEAIFDLQALRTESIRAQLGGGEIAISGALPFFVPSDEQLVATLGELKIDALEGLLESQVEGTLSIGGTALATRIGGDLRASNGTLDLANLPAAPAEAPTAEDALAAAGTPVAASEPSLADLSTEPGPKSVLAKSLQLDSGLPTNSCQFAPDTPLLLQDLRIEAGPLFNVSVPFVADFFTEGSFTVDGPLLDVPKICPAGTVMLTRGTVSIGSTRFRLDNDEEQTATFVPEQGLDPTLDVSLQTQVVETTRQPEITDPGQAEVADEPNTGADFGAAESIRISANVDGRATRLLAGEDELEEILTLESTPSRTDGEILALLGQGVLGGGSALGLASSLTGSLQAAIADALGLSQFSLFPIAIADSGESAEGDGGNSTSIELAAETGIDLTNNVTFSVLAILTQQQPLLYSLRYRVNDRISVRGLTDFSANDSLTVNYETRF